MYKRQIEVEALEEQIQPSIDISSDIDRALANREELKILGLQAKSANIELKRSKRNALPQLDLVGTYSETGFSNTGNISDARQVLNDDPGLGRSVQLNFSVPLTNRSARATALLRSERSL